jgi:hypothetical protein
MSASICVGILQGGHDLMSAVRRMVIEVPGMGNDSAKKVQHRGEYREIAIYLLANLCSVALQAGDDFSGKQLTRNGGYEVAGDPYSD